MTEPDGPSYLRPYLSAAARHGSGFHSLLWASPYTQSQRFDAIRRLGNLHGKSVLDVGCGRADLLEFLLARDVVPADYIGVEMVPELAAAAEQKAAAKTVLGRVPRATILRADFVREPRRMFVGADVVVFSGSLNTVEDADFYPLLRRAFDAAAEALVFNFLSSPALAGAEYLRWRQRGDVLAFARSLSPDVSDLEDYLPGDCTVGVFHDDAPGVESHARPERT